MEEPMTPHRAGALYVALSATCFGAMAIFAKYAYLDGVDVATLLLLRFSIAAVIMIALVVVQRRVWPRGLNLGLLAAMGGIGYVGQSFSFFSALEFASAALVALLLYLHPFIVTVLSAVFFGQALTQVRIVAVLAALVGTALVIGADVSGQPMGIALGVAAALIYSAYLLTANRVMRQEDPVAASTVVMSSAAVVLCVMAAFNGPQLPQSTSGWAAILAIACVSTVVAMVCLFIGIQRLGAADTATLSTLEPVVTTVLAAVFLGEQISSIQVVGGMVILAAVIVLARYGQPVPRSTAQ
ncbi:DMT family transporter [Denitromonas ohlonensis]|uniref:DMT family transporter n=3 Tax=Denitromonas TaxID=139331 RepID=A0A558CI73_9RHOO|nr:DMT family transporter [Denitromonas ohlonensis]TVO77567.1 DMT family transporter [Denitromonas ohlonensis]TVT48458.1 MAG: DMT family transporter [Denitromonas halophila]TVT66568.1 MAG: DMT family transporter [Denitromonas halophila]